jgi:hypothetical protein
MGQTYLLFFVLLNYIILYDAPTVFFTTNNQNSVSNNWYDWLEWLFHIRHLSNPTCIYRLHE